MIRKIDEFFGGSGDGFDDHRHLRANTVANVIKDDDEPIGQNQFLDIIAKQEPALRLKNFYKLWNNFRQEQSRSKMIVDCPLDYKNLDRFSEDIKTVENIRMLQDKIRNNFDYRNAGWGRKNYREETDKFLKNFDFTKSGNNYIVSINGIQIYEVYKMNKIYYHKLFDEPSKITGKSGFYDVCQKMCGEDTLSKVKNATKGYTKGLKFMFDSYNDFSAFESYRYDEEEEEEEEEEEDWDDGPVPTTVSKTELRDIMKDDIKTIKNKKFLDMVRYGQYDEVLSLSKDIDVNCTDQYGDTALHLAVENEDVEMVKILLKLGAVQNMNDDGDYPQDLAVDEPEIMNLLNKSIDKVVVKKKIEKTKGKVKKFLGQFNQFFDSYDYEETKNNNNSMKNLVSFEDYGMNENRFTDLFKKKKPEPKDELAELVSDITRVLGKVGKKFLAEVEKAVDERSIEDIIFGKKTVDEVAKETEKKVDSTTNEAALTFLAAWAIKLYISKKVLNTIAKKFPNSGPGRIKQNLDLIFDTTGKYAVLDITYLHNPEEKGNRKFDRIKLEDLVKKLVDTGVELNDIFIANGRDEEGKTDKSTYFLVIKSNKMKDISKILYDSELSEIGVDYYNGFTLKKTYTNINNIVNDAYFDYFLSKFYRDIKPGLLDKVKNYAAKLLNRAPEMSKVELKPHDENME